MKILGTDIYTTQGDDISITLTCKNPNGTVRPLVTGTDRIYFTVKKVLSSPATNLNGFQLVLDEFPSGLANIVIESALTNNKPVGVYFYDVQLVDGNNKITTIVPKSKFIIQEQVTT